MGNIRKSEMGPESGHERQSLGQVEELVDGYHQLGNTTPLDRDYVVSDLNSRVADGYIDEEQREEVLFRLGLFPETADEHPALGEGALPASQIAVLGIMRGRFSDAGEAADHLLDQ